MSRELRHPPLDQVSEGRLASVVDRSFFERRGEDPNGESPWPNRVKETILADAIRKSAFRRFSRFWQPSHKFAGNEHNTGGKSPADLEMLQQSEDVISSPDQAFDVMDFEPAARKALPPAHFGYLATGVDEDGTVRANREGYSRLRFVRAGSSMSRPSTCLCAFSEPLGAVRS